MPGSATRRRMTRSTSTAWSRSCRGRARLRAPGAGALCRDDRRAGVPLYSDDLGWPMGRVVRPLATRLGIIDLQGAAILAIGAVGALAWSRGPSAASSRITAACSGPRGATCSACSSWGDSRRLARGGRLPDGPLHADSDLGPRRGRQLRALRDLARRPPDDGRLVELGERSLPGARLAAVEVAEPRGMAVAE